MNPYTWEIRSKCTLTLDILEKKIKQMERLTLIIDLSIHVFLTNNPHISEKVWDMGQFKIVLKISEIGRYTWVMAEEFQLYMRKYSFDRNILKFEIFNEKPMIGIWKSTMYTDRFACDVVHQKVSVRYLDQIISILINVIWMNEWECFSSDIRITDKEGELLFEFKWEKEDMITWYKEIDTNHKKKIYPPHLTQDDIEKSYSLIIDHKIEYWKWDYVDSILRNPLFTLKYQSFILAYYSFE